MVAMEVSKMLAEKIRHARTLVARIAVRKYKVTLVVCPSQAIPVWKAECQTFPSMLTLRVFYGSPQTGPHAGRSMVLRSTAIGLLEYLEGLPDEPSTLRHVVLTSYGTWVKRTTFWTGDASIHKRQDFRDKVGQATGMDLDPGCDPFDENDEQDFDQDYLNRLHTFCPGIFHAIIADEAQKLKSPCIRTID